MTRPKCFPVDFAQVGTTPQEVVRDLMAFDKVGSWPEVPGGKPSWFRQMEDLWSTVTHAKELSFEAVRQEAWRMAAKEAVALLEARA